MDSPTDICGTRGHIKRANGAGEVAGLLSAYGAGYKHEDSKAHLKPGSGPARTGNRCTEVGGDWGIARVLGVAG